MCEGGFLVGIEYREQRLSKQCDYLGGAVFLQPVAKASGNVDIVMIRNYYNSCGTDSLIHYSKLFD